MIALNSEQQAAADFLHGVASVVAIKQLLFCKFDYSFRDYQLRW